MSTQYKIIVLSPTGETVYDSIVVAEDIDNAGAWDGAELSEEIQTAVGQHFAAQGSAT